MRRFWLSVASVWSWFVLVAVIVTWLPLMALTWLVTAPFDRGRYATGYLFRQLAVVMVALNPLWRFRRAGPAPADPRRPYVVVSNHESFVDILLISHLPWEMKWLSKAELFRLVILGWEMRMANDIPVVRGDRRSAVEALRACRDRLEKKVSVMIFPEGTRSASGALLPFKDGAFRLAVEGGYPILPLALAGTRHALQKHSWRMNPATAVVRVLDPIETTGLGAADVPALRERVRDTIQAARNRLYAELGLPVPEEPPAIAAEPGTEAPEEVR
jgi:1-acyl-sn-glycerol-3-phosphate acyltransferase